MGTTSRGIPLLHDIFFKVTDHESLVAIMQKSICSPRQMCLAIEEFTCLAQAHWPGYRCDQGLGDVIGAPLPFCGDNEWQPRIKGNCPPLAWTLMWQGKYSFLFGQCIPAWTQDGGYVMWDAERIESTGARAILERLAPELSLDIFDYIDGR